jgi:hypothetical protein
VAVGQVNTAASTRAVTFSDGTITDLGSPGNGTSNYGYAINMLRIGHKGGNMNIHAWLTLPSTEIIDVSLATTMGIVQKRPEMLGLAITRPADELNGMAYKPMLVGDGFLRKTGLLIEW